MRLPTIPTSSAAKQARTLRERRDELAHERDELIRRLATSAFLPGTGRPPRIDAHERAKAQTRTRELGTEIAELTRDQQAAERDAGSEGWQRLEASAEYRAAIRETALAWSAQLEPLAALVVLHGRARRDGIAVPARAELPLEARSELRTLLHWLEAQPLDPADLPDGVRALLESRGARVMTLHLRGLVTAEKAAGLGRELDQHHGNVRLEIDSRGGDMEAGIPLAEKIAQRGRVMTVIMGVAESTAGAIWAAGAERECSPGGSLLVHEPTITPLSTRPRYASEVAEAAATAADLERRSLNLMARASSRSAAWWRSVAAGEGRRFDRDALVALGLVRGVAKAERTPFLASWQPFAFADCTAPRMARTAEAVAVLAADPSPDGVRELAGELRRTWRRAPALAAAVGVAVVERRTMGRLPGNVLSRLALPPVASRPTIELCSLPDDAAERETAGCLARWLLQLPADPRSNAVTDAFAGAWMQTDPYRDAELAGETVPPGRRPRRPAFAS